MKSLSQLSKRAEAIYNIAKELKVSAAINQFEPSYALDPSKRYILALDMILNDPKVTKIGEKEIAYMESYIGEFQEDNTTVTFHKISLGQIYNKFKLVETNQYEFRTRNLVELTNSARTEPSLFLLLKALSSGAIILEVEDLEKDIIPCELYDKKISDIAFFTGEMNSDKELTKRIVTEFEDFIKI